MATASSAQREPSMEEILASIRRIIEDGDSGRKPMEAYELRQDLEPGPAERLAGNAERPARDSGRSSVDANAFRAEFGDETKADKTVTLAEVKAQASAADSSFAPVNAPARGEAASPHPSITLAEIGAQVSAGASAPQIDAAAASGSVAPGETFMDDWRRDIAAAGRQEQAASDVVEPDLEQPRSEMRHETEAEVEIFEDELVEPQAASAIEAADKPGFEASANRPAILSEHTGRQVAAAFGELSEAFAARGKKSFDEMAEEMLRPMLQDWLDNNLPILVERLVREEIERVARGA